MDLSQFAYRVASANTIEEVAGLLRAATREALGCAGTTFVLRDGADCFTVDEDVLVPAWRGQRFPARACIGGWAIVGGYARITDLLLDTRVPPDVTRPGLVRGVAVVPVDTTAALGAYWTHPHAASNDELGLLRELVDVARPAIRRTVRTADRFASSP